MIEVIFPSRSFSDLKQRILNSDLESCAVLLANFVPLKDGGRLLVQEVRFISEFEYLNRTPISIQVNPLFIAPVVKEAVLTNKHLIFVHTHPDSAKSLHFSVIDDEGERIIANFLDSRGLNSPHVSLILNNNLVKARRFGSIEEVRVVQVGPDYTILYDSKSSINIEASYDRQIRAFGKLGQGILKKIRVGIIGLGGTGSVIAQQLAHLGVRDFLLLDPDTVDITNLNRLIGSTLNDVNSNKVEVASHLIQSINPSAYVQQKVGSIIDIKTTRLLLDTDFLFCCTDSHGSRAILNQLAYQYFIPCIDMGVSIVVQNDHVKHITGRVQMLSPGLGCLTCANILNSDLVRYDLMTSYERQKDPYFVGAAVPEPSVISLNSTVASLAITMFLGAMTGMPSSARYQIYNGIDGSVRSISFMPDPTCIVCSRRGALGRGDEWILPARQK